MLPLADVSVAGPWYGTEVQVIDFWEFAAKVEIDEAEVQII